MGAAMSGEAEGLGVSRKQQGPTGGCRQESCLKRADRGSIKVPDREEGGLSTGC